jgi:hypothetical protein
MEIEKEMKEEEKIVADSDFKQEEVRIIKVKIETVYSMIFSSMCLK